MDLQPGTEEGGIILAFAWSHKEMTFQEMLKDVPNSPLKGENPILL